MWSVTEVIVSPSLNETIFLDRQAVPFAGIEHPSKQTVIVRPCFTVLPSMLKKLIEAIDLCIEVVQMVKCDRFKGFRSTGCAPLMPSVV